MTAEEYFYNHWQKANRSRFGDYGDYDSDEYAIAFANDYAALRIHDVVGRSEQFCSCSFVMIMRDVNTDVPFCAECGKEVNEQN